MRLILSAVLGLSMLAMSANATNLMMTGLGNNGGGGGGGCNGTIDLSTGCAQPSMLGV